MLGLRHLCAFDDVDDPRGGVDGKHGDGEFGIGGGEAAVGGVGNVVGKVVVLGCGGCANGDDGVVGGEASGGPGATGGI